MAAKKKKPTAKKPAPKKKAPVAKKKKGTHRDSPMHTQVAHPELDDEDHEEVFEIFKVYDRNGSGSIDRGEFARLLDFYHIPWLYEPTSFALNWSGDTLPTAADDVVIDFAGSNSEVLPATCSLWPGAEKSNLLL